MPTGEGREPHFFAYLTFYHIVATSASKQIEATTVVGVRRGPLATVRVVRNQYNWSSLLNLNCLTVFYGLFATKQRVQVIQAQEL